MKAFDFYKRKSLGRKLAILSLTAVMVVSCGSDKEGNTTNTAAPVTTANPFGNTTNISQQDVSNWNNLKSSQSCSQGRMNDMVFTLQPQQSGYYGSSSVSGYLQSGSASGSSQGNYFGMSANKDLVWVSKVSNGSTLTYNVVISFCQFTDPMYGTQYIGPNAQMSNFYVNGLVLNNGSSCATGAVTTGQIGFYSPTYGGYVPINVASAGINCY